MSIRKKLGQNFLNSKSLAKFIVDSAKISKNDVVYEIGIGKGILTPFLCEKAKNVISVEKIINFMTKLLPNFLKLKISKSSTVMDLNKMKNLIFLFQIYHIRKVKKQFNGC